MSGQGRGAAVTVAVVSYNTRELLLGCLQSLEPEARAGTAEVWVVDNGSTDGSAEAARVRAPWARVIEPGENLGFGRAVNLVAAEARSSWLACANADIRLEPGALGTMLEAGREPQIGCVAPRLVLPDGSTEHSLHSLPTIPFTLALNFGVHRLWPSWGDRVCIPGWTDFERPRSIQWAIGAFLLLRREAFAAVGGFDERQWMYAEDLDLGWRLHQRGWIARYEPRAHVHHASGAATRPVFGEDRRMRFMRASYAVMVRRRGRPRTWITAAINVAGAAVRVAWMGPLAKLWPRLRAPAAENRRWLSAHRQGLRSALTPASEG